MADGDDAAAALVRQVSPEWSTVPVDEVTGAMKNLFEHSFSFQFDNLQAVLRWLVTQVSDLKESRKETPSAHSGGVDRALRTSSSAGARGKRTRTASFSRAQ